MTSAMRVIPYVLIGALMPLAAAADPPTVTGTKATRDAMGWKISVTLRHPDTGWDHYADGWDILDPAGRVLATRTLHHPHVNEQPFTRSLRQVMLPDGLRQVFIRAHCSDGAVSAPLVRIDIPF